MSHHPPFPSMPFMAEYAPLLRLFKGSPRRGPGSEASTLRALSQCPLPERPVVADLGCGSGASTLVLARELQVPILALDADGMSLDDLWEAARMQGLSHLVEPRTADMAHSGIAPRSLDLLWSEGAIDILGWEEGLRIWRDLVRPGGLMAITETTWLIDDPPEEARKAWESWYPGMGWIPDRIQIARDLGLEVLGHFTLPQQDWRDYFNHAEAQCQELSEQADLVECIAGMRGEVDLYHRFGHSYGYVFFIMRRL